MRRNQGNHWHSPFLLLKDETKWPAVSYPYCHSSILHWTISVLRPWIKINSFFLKFLCWSFDHINEKTNKFVKSLVFLWSTPTDLSSFQLSSLASTKNTFLQSSRQPSKDKLFWDPAHLVVPHRAHWPTRIKYVLHLNVFASLEIIFQPVTDTIQIY